MLLVETILHCWQIWAHASQIACIDILDSSNLLDFCAYPRSTARSWANTSLCLREGVDKAVPKAAEVQAHLQPTCGGYQHCSGHAQISIVSFSYPGCKERSVCAHSLAYLAPTMWLTHTYMTKMSGAAGPHHALRLWQQILCLNCQGWDGSLQYVMKSFGVLRELQALQLRDSLTTVCLESYI